MSRNTVHKVAVKDTTESSKKADSKGGEASEVRRSYGKRPDGTEKGSGWLGELKLPNGGVATEYSIGVNLDGKETLIPSLVPTLTKEQVATMVNDIIPNGKRVPDEIIKAAALHAKERIAKGESVWAPNAKSMAPRLATMYGVPVRRTLYDSESQFFKTADGMKTAGMLAEDGKIIFNPYFGLDDVGERLLASNEATRYHLRKMGDGRPAFAITDEQKKFFTGTPYEGHDRDLMDTIIARGVAGDNLRDYDLTDEQKQIVEKVRSYVESKEVRQDARGGDTGEEVPNETASEEMVPESGTEISNTGPRIVINPSTFKNKKDALCVAYNEAYRVVMEMNGFDPVSEPTGRQREFFGDTAYADDENMLRRTILARICTFDTSVGDPTDEQLEEAVEFLETVMEIGAPQNEWEQSIVQRTHDILKASIGMPRKEREPENPAPVQGGTNEDAGGGDTDEINRSPQEQDVQVQRSSQEQDVQVQRSSQEQDVQVQRSPQERPVQVQPKEDDNGPSPEDPHANDTSPQPDANPVNDRIMSETENINKPDDSAITGEKQGVQTNIDSSGLRAMLLHAEGDEDEEI